MLRLTLMSRSAEEAVLKVDGWLAGADVALLDQEGGRHLQEGKRLVLELKGVKFIDSAGIALLQEWAGAQLVLRGASPFVHLLLKDRGLA